MIFKPYSQEPLLLTSKKMTHEELQNDLHTMSDRKLIEEATIQLDKLCAKSFTMHVPPRVNDTDLIFGEVIRRFESLVINK